VMRPTTRRPEQLHHWPELPRVGDYEKALSKDQGKLATTSIQILAICSETIRLEVGRPGRLAFGIQIDRLAKRLEDF
jgi:hypothetical protein